MTTITGAGAHASRAASDVAPFSKAGTKGHHTLGAIADYVVGAHNGGLRAINVTALRAIDAAANVTDGAVVEVLGNAAIGDCRPFFVVWDADSAADHDGLSVFRPTVGAASSGAGRFLRVNTSQHARAFTGGDATPSVFGGGEFYTSGSTAITNFDDGAEGDVITVHRGDADIQIADNANIATANDRSFYLTAFTPSASFRKEGGVWKQIGAPLFEVTIDGSEHKIGFGPIVGGRYIHEWISAAAADITGDAVRPRYWNGGGFITRDYGDGPDIAGFTGDGDWTTPADIGGWKALLHVYGTGRGGGAFLSAAASAPIYSARDGENVHAVAGTGFYSASNVSSPGAGYGVYAYDDADLLNFGGWVLLTEGVDYTSDVANTRIELLIAPGKDKISIRRKLNWMQSGPFTQRSGAMHVYATEAHTAYSRGGLVQLSVTGPDSIAERPAIWALGLENNRRVFIGGRGVAEDVSGYQVIDHLNIDSDGAWYHRGVEATAAKSMNPRRWAGSAALNVPASDIANDYALSLVKTTDTDVSLDIGLEHSSGEWVFATRATGGGARTQVLRLTAAGVLKPHTSGVTDLGASGARFNAMWGQLGNFAQPLQSTNALRVKASHASFDNAVVTILSGRAASTAFDLLTCVTGDDGTPTNTFTVTGAGGVWACRGTAMPAGGTTGRGLRFSTATNFGVFFGSGAPTLSAAQGSLYLRSDGSSTSTRAYVNTDGGTTWTAITTAA